MTEVIEKGMEEEAGRNRVECGCVWGSGEEECLESVGVLTLAQGLDRARCCAWYLIVYEDDMVTDQGDAVEFLASLASSRICR